MPEIGDEIKFRPSAFGNDTHPQGPMSNTKSVRGIVCFVNAAHRWYLVEWMAPNGDMLREGLKF